MYKRMLIPLDGSEVAEVVFPYVEYLAGRLGFGVVFLHISSPALKEYQPMIKAYMDHAADVVRAGAIRLQQSYPDAPVRPVPVQVNMVHGYPADEILRYSEEERADLVVLASHGRSGRKQWALGSVADKVLRSSRIPVFLVPFGAGGRPDGGEWSARTMIVPLDGSELAETVLPHVEALAGQGGKEGMEVVLVRACEPPAIPTYYSPELSQIPLHWGEYAEQETAQCKKVAAEYLVGVEKNLRDAGMNVRSEVLVGKASDEIVDYASKTPDALIVMATHGRSGLSRLVYGSVALNILVGVTNPIFLIKPTAKQ